MAPFTRISLNQKPSRAVFHAVQCRADDGTHEYAGFFRSDKSRIFQVNDPCCGAGCLLLAGYNAMREQLEPTDPDWDKYVLFVAQDIDPLVCKMCYIQMCCIGVPGVVVAGNSLFPDAEREPTDFWFTHKYFALDEKALENTYQQKKE